MTRTSIAILGSGNIGSDLLLKILQRSESLEVAAMIGIDPESEGLQRAKSHGIPVTAEGIEGFLKMPQFEATSIVFDATSAAAHHHHDRILQQHDKQVIDLTPAAIGPYVVPTVNLDQHLFSPNINLVTCGGQATIPIVAAIHQVAPVRYAEIVASISSRSAGPGTRANIDEFTVTTARGIESVGGAERGKAIIVLNPADPPILMRNTVFSFVEGENDLAAIEESVKRRVEEVNRHVPGYRLKQDVQFDAFGKESDRQSIPGVAKNVYGTKVTVYLEVEGAGDFLPRYAGNLDIMTSAAVATAERLVELRQNQSHHPGPGVAR